MATISHAYPLISKALASVIFHVNMKTADQQIIRGENVCINIIILVIYSIFSS